MGSSSRRLLNQTTHSSVAYSTISNERHASLDHLGVVESKRWFPAKQLREIKSRCGAFRPMVAPHSRNPLFAATFNGAME